MFRAHANGGVLVDFEVVPLHATASAADVAAAFAAHDAGAAVGEGAADVLGPSLNASKQEIEDVASKIGGGLSSVGSGVITQMNTMLLVLAGAYVLGQAVSGK